MPRILVVEDDSDVQQLYVDVLGEAGFDVRTATTDVTLAIIDKEPVDVVTIDIGEHGGGLVLAASLNRIDARPKLIAVTGRPVGIVDQALFDRFLIKPLLPKQLLSTIHDVLRDRTGETR